MIRQGACVMKLFKRQSVIVTIIISVCFGQVQQQWLQEPKVCVSLAGFHDFRNPRYLGFFGF